MVGTYDGGGVAGGGGAGGGGALPRPVFCRLAGPSRSGGGVLFFDEEKRSSTRGGCGGGGGVKMSRKTERESSELWKGARAKAEYFAVLEGRFRWPMT
jgi:hypothetical protein